MARKREFAQWKTPPICSEIEVATPRRRAPSKQSGPKVDTPNYAKPSRHGEAALVQDAAQYAARLRAGSATS
jgi:hypothetical protein